MPASLSEFELLLLHSGNEAGTAVLLVLAWIAASDGTIDEAETQQLVDIAGASGYSQDIHHIISLARRRNLDALQLAAEIIADEFGGDPPGSDKPRQFLTMAIGTAMADGELLASEIHILRLLADLLGLKADELDTLSREIAGSKMPPPDDLSTAAYWREQPQDERREPDATRREPREPSRAESSGGNRQAVAAYAALGLPVDAGRDQITEAYRRLSAVHDPARFTDLGGEAVAAATATHSRIKNAYDHLVRYA